jgi:hypothetical protein
MRLNKLLEGIQILQPYYKNPDGFECGADHDVFYMFSTDQPLPAQAVARLIALGWVQDAVRPADEHGDFIVTDYDPNESWSAHV